MAANQNVALLAGQLVMGVRIWLSNGWKNLPALSPVASISNCNAMACQLNWLASRIFLTVQIG